MKKVLMSLTIAGLIYSGANAQSTIINACGSAQNKVCRVSKDRKTTSCYKTGYAENFQVCKGNFGYFICCETPDFHNSTNPGFVFSEESQPQENQNQYTPMAYKIKAADLTYPINQSYVNTISGTK